MMFLVFGNFNVLTFANIGVHWSRPVTTVEWQTPVLCSGNVMYLSNVPIVMYLSKVHRTTGVDTWGDFLHDVRISTSMWQVHVPSTRQSPWM